MSAARQMRAPQPAQQPVQPSPMKADDPNALERLARNASPHTRSTSPFAQQAQRQAMQQQMAQQQMVQQQRAQQMPQQAPTGYQPLPGYPVPQGYAPQGYAPQSYAPRQMQQPMPQLRGPKRPRR